MRKTAFLLVGLLLLAMLPLGIMAEESVSTQRKDAFIETLLVYYLEIVDTDGTIYRTNQQYRQYTFVNGYTDSTRKVLDRTVDGVKYYHCYVSYTFY